MQQWEAKQAAAEADCRFDEVEAEYTDAVDELTGVFEQAAAIRAVTMEGLQCKARLTCRDECDDDLAASIARDLLALQTGAVS